MLEAKYFRDYKHSYMILPCKSEQPEKSYQCRQLISNKIEELLRCSMRHVNGMTYFYYDISSRTTMESLYRDRQMSFCQIRELFEQLYGMYCRVGDFFLDETRLVFAPEYIFYDLSRKKYVGLYYPDYEEDRPYEALMDYLLEHMDSRDEHLADYIYQIYERAENGGFSLWDALQILGESEEQEETDESGGQRGEILSFPGNSSLETEHIGTACARLDLRDSQEDMPALWEDVAVSAKRKSPFSLFIVACSALGIAGIVYIYGVYELSDEEVMTLLGCGALMGICLLAGLIGILKGGAKKGRTGKMGQTRQKETESGYAAKMTERDLQAQELVSLEHVLSRGSEEAFPEHIWGGDGEKVMPAAGGKRSGVSEVEDYSGNTVFFDSAKRTEYKLYALDKKNKKHIELTKFPFTVGKMAGCVDCVLADDSVSRIHARFERVGDTIQLTDMNSTNGTYRNGLRMQPQETVEIEPGDEIRFGNLNYCYR